MSANSVSSTLRFRSGPPPPADIAGSSNRSEAPSPSGPPVSLSWMDNADNETGFVVERCTVVLPATTCGNFAQIAAPGPLTGTGFVTYVDTTVAGGNTYMYRVKAVNAAGSSAYATLSVPVTAIAAPTDFTVRSPEYRQPVLGRP